MYYLTTHHPFRDPFATCGHATLLCSWSSHWLARSFHLFIPSISNPLLNPVPSEGRARRLLRTVASLYMNVGYLSFCEDIFGLGDTQSQLPIWGWFTWYYAARNEGVLRNEASHKVDGRTTTYGWQNPLYCNRRPEQTCKQTQHLTVQHKKHHKKWVERKFRYFHLTTRGNSRLRRLRIRS